MNPAREEALKFLRLNPDPEVLIVGGGINGIGTFWDLALQGVRVTLIERGDFCSGASSASSHMIHGGIRYLENGEFRLVREAVQERNRLLRNAPHAVKPLPTAIPVFKLFSGLGNAPLKLLGILDKPAERGALVIKIGLSLYDAYARSQKVLPRHRFRSRKNSLALFPDLNPEIIGTAVYFDAAMPAPERIGLELVLDGEAANPNARAINYTSLESTTRDTVIARDQVSGESIAIRPQVLINATGPWIDFTNRRMGQESHFIGGTKGSHLVLDHPELLAALHGHEMFFENNDGRIVLIYPFMNRVLVGTSDIPIEDPDTARCTGAEVDYFLEMVRKVFPAIKVDRSQIVYRFSGVRPLAASSAHAAGQISRDHTIHIAPPGKETVFPVFSLVGGKWTSFRAFTEQTADLVLERLGKQRRLLTRDIPIGGGKNYPRNEAEKIDYLESRQRSTDLAMFRLESLFRRYGTRMDQLVNTLTQGEDTPLVENEGYTREEVVFLATHEKVVHLDDLLLRRTLLGMQGELSRKLLVEIAALLSSPLKWSSQTQTAEIDRAIRVLADRHGVQL